MNKDFVIKEAEGITKRMDDLWLKFESSDAYKNEDFRNYLMWVEHDINKHVFRIKHELGFFNK